MLNKRFSDFIVIGLFVLVLSIIIVIRVVVINFYDTRITDLEDHNARLRVDILLASQVVSDYRQGDILSLGELYLAIPQTFRRDYLVYELHGLLEEVGISNAPENSRHVIVTSLPILATSLPQGSPYRIIAQNYNLYEIELRFNLDEDIDEYHALMDLIENNDRLFLLKSVVFDNRLDDKVGIKLNLYAVYHK